MLSQIKEKVPIISIVVPMYNESPNLETFYNRISRVIDSMGLATEIICVNDGSQDDTLARLYELNKRDGRFKVINLSRNFGKEIALTAGLDYSSGEAVIPIDADLQDPPELIPELVAKWREGYDVVYATRQEREGETPIKKLTAYVFYRVIGKLTRIDIPRDTGDFRLMSRQVVNSLNTIREHHRFMKGIFSWVGYNQTSLSYNREPRFAGQTKWNYWKLWNLALEGITSFSFVPLQLVTYLGLIIAGLSFSYGLFIIFLTVVFGNPVPGYPSIMVVILFLGGIQLFVLGMIGEYIGRIYNESKRRPLYFVRDMIGFNTIKHENSLGEIING